MIDLWILWKCKCHCVALQKSDRDKIWSKVHEVTYTVISEVPWLLSLIPFHRGACGVVFFFQPKNNLPGFPGNSSITWWKMVQSGYLTHIYIYIRIYMVIYLLVIYTWYDIYIYSAILEPPFRRLGLCSFRPGLGGASSHQWRSQSFTWGCLEGAVTDVQACSLW